MSAPDYGFEWFYECDSVEDSGVISDVPLDVSTSVGIGRGHPYRPDAPIRVTSDDVRSRVDDLLDDVPTGTLQRFHQPKVPERVGDSAPRPGRISPGIRCQPVSGPDSSATTMSCHSGYALVSAISA